MILEELNIEFRGHCHSLGDVERTAIYEDMHPLSPGYLHRFHVPDTASQCDVIRALVAHRRFHSEIRNPKS